MNIYRINYIDGPDMRYKSFETKAKNEDDALSNLWSSCSNGDFDHRIAEIIKLDNVDKIGVYENGYRIGEEIVFHVPFTR